MRRALGRLLGVVLSLVLVSVIALAALSKLAEALGRQGHNERRLPLFVNTRPSNVHDRAEHAISELTQGRNVAAAEQELVRLGGAALPHVLPKLDELRPAVRGRVATALGPVAERMELGRASELSSPERAIAFWGRFWQDHAFDFRPQVVRRLVRRLAERSSALARDDIVRLDTYAVPELVAALGRVRTLDDVQRARRVTLILSHVTGRGPVVDRNASVAEARAAARSWRQFFSEEGADFTALDGPRRVTAMFAQTQYGRWLGRVFGLIRIGHERQPALGVQPSQALRSATRYLVSLLLGLGASVIWARLELRLGAPLDGVLRAFAALVIAVPTAFVAGAMQAPQSGWGRGLLATLLTTLLGAAVLSRTQLSRLLDARFREIPWRSLFADALGALPAALPWIATALFGLELALNLDGVARAAYEGLGQADVTAAMSLALGGALVVAAGAAGADLVIGRAVAVERQPALIEVGGLGRTRLLWGGLATILVLGVFGANWSSLPSSSTPGWPEVAQGARAFLAYGLITWVVAGLTGFSLGTLAAGGPRPFDAALVRTSELAGALPAVLWAAALAQAFGFGVVLAMLLGILRGIDVAWMLRAELMRRAQGDPELGLRSLGHYPLSAFYRRRLRPAALPALCTLCLTPAWWVAIGAVAWLTGARAIPGQRGWDALFGSTHALTLPAIVAAALISLVTWVLLGFVTALPRKLGAFRASIPPPALSAREPGEGG